MRNKKSSKRTLLLIAVIIISLGVIGWWIYDRQASNSNDVIDGVDYGPPTQEEKDAGDQRKDEIDQEEEQRNEPQDTSKKKVVSIEIADAAQYDDIIEVRSFIPGHVEDGTCTLEFTKGDQKFTKHTPAKADASSTICLNPNIKRSEFPEIGDWELVIMYDSQTATGTSKPQAIGIK